MTKDVVNERYTESVRLVSPGMLSLGPPPPPQPLPLKGEGLQTCSNGEPVRQPFPLPCGPLGGEGLRQQPHHMRYEMLKMPTTRASIGERIAQDECY
jgi:hypothetical protein